MENGQLIQAAVKLTQALNKSADDQLPGKLAGIVKLHAGIAVAGAFIPIPVADIAAAAGNIWTMYVRINKELDLPFRENLIKSIAAGIATNLGAAAAGTVIIGSAFKFIPGLGTLGGAVILGATVYGITIASGIIYMNAVAKLLNSKNTKQFDEEDLKQAVDEVMEDKEAVQSIFNNAKKDYKEEKKKKEV
jgi:uncharacterized protein (DUF697 family)